MKRIAFVSLGFAIIALSFAVQDRSHSFSYFSMLRAKRRFQSHRVWPSHSKSCFSWASVG